MKSRVLRRVAASAAALACAVLGAVALPAAPAAASPIRNATPWSVLLCKYCDTPAEPQTAVSLRQVAHATGSAPAGWRTTSPTSPADGCLAGSVVRGWYTMPYTLAQARPRPVGPRTRTAWTPRRPRATRCRPATVSWSSLNDAIDSGAAGDRVLLDPAPGTWASPRTRCCTATASATRSPTTPTYQNGPGPARRVRRPVGRDQRHAHLRLRHGAVRHQRGRPQRYHRDKLGWLAKNRVFTFGRGRRRLGTLTLARLEMPAAGGPQLIRIPFDPADPFHYYTVELRRKLGWTPASRPTRSSSTR